MFVSEFLKEYLKWFVPLATISILLYFLFKPLPLVGLLMLIMPMDRARVKMLRNNFQIPELKEAWKIIAICLLPPIVFSTFLGFVVTLEPGELRANAVISFQFVFVIPVFLVASICFLSKRTWSRALKKHGKQ
jgi:hypothetical protein